MKTIYRSIKRVTIFVRTLRTASPFPTDKEFAPYGLFCSLLLLFVLLGTGIGNIWAQTDYSGTYYIASDAIVDKVHIYDADAPANNYYLCPTENWCYYQDPDNFWPSNTAAGNKTMPFLTTYKCRTKGYHSGNASDAIWAIEKASGSGYYYIKQASTGRYLTSNGQVEKAGIDRIRVHLESIDNPNDAGNKILFDISQISNGDIVISPQGIQETGTHDKVDHSTHRWLVVNGGNKNNLTGQSGKTGGPTGYTNTAGIIGIYTQDDANAPFILEKALSIDPPTITNNYDGTFTISAATGATIYYTTDGTTPTIETTTTGTTSVIVNQTAEMTVIKALAKVTSDPFPTVVTTYYLPVCERPAINVSGGIVTITCATAGAVIHYTTDGSPATTSSTTYSAPFAKGGASTIRAIATKAGYVISSEGTLMPATEVSSSSEITDMMGNYKLSASFSSTASIGTSEEPFKGTIDGNMVTISGLNHPLVAYAYDAIIKNIILDNVNISGGTNVGAICAEATGDTRIFNCGVLATNSTATTGEDGYTAITSCSSTISGSNYVGGIVGLLDGSSRVINCFSYANVNGGSEAGGIVGHNNVATTATNLKTMVMNCMFYGEVSGGSIAPIYNGEIITNVGENTGVSNFNYFRLESSYIQNTDITKVYNCALGAETRFLQRFEFFRHLLNSHRELAAWWATGSMKNKDEMMKWVLEPAQIGSSTPYPVLKVPAYYPSVVNIDAGNAPTTTERNMGAKLGTLSVTIQSGNGKVFEAPTGASITKSRLTLNITDKDSEHFNFNYYKVQLPYYNDVGTGNYTDNRVVTGWKIVSITGGTPGTYTESDSWGGYNFADRNCTNKDLYGSGGSNRVFSQGAYWDVPEGVTAITIEPYWAKAAYLADENADIVYNTDMSTSYKVPGVGGGKIYNNGSSYSIAGNSQKVYTSLSSAVSGLGITGTPTVNDYAVVLVGNYHHVVANNVAVSGSSPYTVTSVDLDGDDEPDYSLMLRNNGRNPWHPVKWDFINIPGLGMAQKSTGSTAEGSYNLGIVVPTNWFETTNTSLFRVTQFEYERKGNHTTSAPYILQGGVMEQWVTGQQDGNDSPKNITYFHVGGNVWFKEFHRGVHQDKTAYSNHPPVSVTGGDFDKFYLTGLYRADVTSYGDNAECYINGGRFGEVAGAAMEGIGKANGADDTGNITWLIQNADIKEFYGGGLNADRPVTGNISTTITGGKIDLFCGGPKFGDMSTGKTVTTTATGCEFGTFFGAGYGGSSYSRRAPRNITNMINMPATTGDSKAYDSWNAWVKAEYKQKTATNFPGISTRFDYQFIPNSGNADNVGRLFVEHVLFSLATTRNVTSTLTNCTITGNFYGGGSLGKVDGPVTSTLTNCNVIGNVFGAGYSASLPTVEVDSIGFRVEPYYYTDLGTYRTGVKGKTTTYKWEHGEAVAIDTEENILYTTEDLDGLGSVSGNATLTIEGTTTVAGSVYGGGEESGVGGNTIVSVTGGTIGTSGQIGAEYGNVFGGGKGKPGDVTAGLVKGDTKVTISNSPTIYHNVYGGGAFGSVGEFDYHATTGMPTGRKAETTGGDTEVIIKGGTFGWNGNENGNVFGSSRGDVSVPGTDGFDPNDRMAWVYSTHVTIGDTGAETSPTIKGCVYGSGENGHTFQNTLVDINKGIVGITTGETIGDYSGAAYPYRGNVFGGGSGMDTYWIDADENGEVDEGEKHFNPTAGIVYGNSTVNITGGQVVHNVYGAGAMGSVGNPSNVNSGKTTVNISGGRIGYDGNRNGNVFGAARGEYGISTSTSRLANVRESEVNISYTTTPTEDDEDKTVKLIAGSVFGGGESGTVKESVTVNMTGGLILKDIYGGGALADTQTSNWDAYANNEAGGWAPEKTSASTTTTVRLTGGTILGEAYGGGLGETGKPAYVYGDVLLDLNGTTISDETGTAIAENARGCVVHEVFGCNNAAGTPMGNVTVHVYATQNATATQIANTDGETPVTGAKTKGSYDVKAVYGGGNLAAYEPAGGKNTTNGTNVIIDGCGLTSIQTVYGGGNAASTPATKVTVNGTFEIEELFGGGNGKDAIVINNETKPNPGANVGFYDYSAVESTYDTKEKRQQDDFVNNYVYGSGKATVNIFGGTIHRVFGGSNTKGNVRQTALTLLDEGAACAFCVDEAYGGGKSAEMDAEAQLLMACIPGLQAVYGGAEAADVHGNVTLNITNGTFDRVFGGNNLSGTIGGAITVNVEEIGCKPIIIGELYGGGNQAGYSIYGYDGVDANGKAILKESGSNPWANPEVNVISFTSIGEIYGGGFGADAVMVGSPTVNVNVAYGKYYDKDASIVGEDAKTPHNYPIPSHAKGKMGAINNVFGGGNAAQVKGNTYVNIGTTVGDITYEEVKNIEVGTTVVTSYYTRSDAGTEENHYSYVAPSVDAETCDADGKAVTGKTYYRKVEILGADIRGNVYGGGNNAEVTGDSKVKIGKKDEGE